MASITLLADPPAAPKFLWTSTRHPPRIPTVLLLAPTSTCAPRLGLVQCTAAVTKPRDQSPVRRSGNYKPSIWTDNYIQSLKSDYEVTIITSEFNTWFVRCLLCNHEFKRHMVETVPVSHLQKNE